MRHFKYYIVDLLMYQLQLGTISKQTAYFNKWTKVVCKKMYNLQFSS